MDIPDRNIIIVPPDKLTESDDVLQLPKTKAQGANLLRSVSFLLSLVFCIAGGGMYLFALLTGVTGFFNNGGGQFFAHEVFSSFQYSAIVENAGEAPSETTAPPETSAIVENAPQTAAPETETPLETSAAPQSEPEAAASYPIQDVDLSADAENGFFLHNETDYEPDLNALLQQKLPIESLDELYAEYGNDAPVVLIIHTHATESYSPEGSNTYKIDQSFRSQDTSQNVVAVGEVMTKTLNDAGVNTLHCTELFDAESYVDSYNRSAAAIVQYIKNYPSLRYIFDVHRDSIIDAKYMKYRPITEVSGERCAQFMIVCGTNFKGADHPGWENNLALAAKLQSALYNKYDGLCRGINLRGAAFNQKYLAGSLLLEVGSCGNTLSEAKRTAKLAASELAAGISG